MPFRSLSLHSAQVLEPKEEKYVFKNWDEIGTQMAQLDLMDDDEQPLPANVMYPGTSDYWRSDFDE